MLSFAKYDMLLLPLGHHVPIVCEMNQCYLVTINLLESKMTFNWAVSRQNQHNGSATSMDPDQPAHPRSLIRIHAVRLPTLLQVEKLIANSIDPDQTARMRRLVWIHAGRKRTMLVLSWCGSYIPLKIDISRLVIIFELEPFDVVQIQNQ